MSAGRGPRRLARVTGSAALTLGVAAGAVAGSSGVASAGSASAAGPARSCCTIRMQSAAVGWGNNFVGELGNGTNLQIASPNWTGVSGLSSGVVQVSAGQDASLALTSDGSVWAWGANLGNGTPTYSSSSVPVQVPGLAGITQVAAGVNEDLALRSDGTVWAWGDDNSGDLGDGAAGPSTTPVQVAGLTGVTQISVGGGFSLALRSDGTVWSWGNNEYGELGNGTTSDSSVPVQVTGLSRVTSISAGLDDSMAVETTGFIVRRSSVYEWGDNDQGQIGDGTFRERPVPVQITGIGTQTVAGIAAGGNFSMVLGSDGTLWAWGVNTFGQLGDGAIYDEIQPVEVRGLDSGITQIAAGNSHALALQSDGTVWAWGQNGAGQLGNGTTSGPSGANPTPVQVVGLANATQVAAGWSFSLAVHQVPFILLPGARKEVPK